MYFLREGSVEIRTENDLQNVLYDGSYFGGEHKNFCCSKQDTTMWGQQCEGGGFIVVNNFSASF